MSYVSRLVSVYIYSKLDVSMCTIIRFHQMYLCVPYIPVVKVCLLSLTVGVRAGRDGTPQKITRQGRNNMILLHHSTSFSSF